MNQALKILVCGAAAAAACLAGGCGGRDLGRGGFAPGPSKPPPGFPAPQDVPADPQLVAAARQELNNLTRSGKAIDRAHAIEGMRYAMGGEAAEPVAAALADRSPLVRFAAAMAAGELKLEAARPALRAAAEDADPRVQVGARFALHRLGDFARTRDLEVYARDPRPAVRGTTAMVLGRLGESSGTNILRVLRGDPEVVVRQQAEEGLFLLGDDRGREAVIGYTGSRYPDDVMFGLLALAENKDGRFRAHARGHLTNDYSEVALVAARAMGAMNADDGYGVAMAGIKSPDARQRQLAASAFGAIGRADARPYLAPALKDGDAEVRAAAATAVLKIAQAPKRFSREGDVNQ